MVPIISVWFDNCPKLQTVESFIPLRIGQREGPVLLLLSWTFKQILLSRVQPSFSLGLKLRQEEWAGHDQTSISIKLDNFCEALPSVYIIIVIKRFQKERLTFGPHVFYDGTLFWHQPSFNSSTFNKYKFWIRFKVKTFKTLFETGSPIFWSLVLQIPNSLKS